jgi:Kef-type K+ transport system membrane component KefB
MSKYKNFLFYIIFTGSLLLLMYLVVIFGEPQEISKVNKFPVASESDSFNHFLDAFGQNVSHPLALLILQIITIIIAARSLSYLFRKIGQPAVIGEIVAGILLGPSFAGHYFPGFSAFLFAPASLPNLQFFSQFGLILFMFIVGMELDLNTLKKKAQEAFIISHASIILPFALGMCLASFMYGTYAPDGVYFLSFGLFMGIALSITAFPVLARIVQERKLSRTHVGNMAIICAAINDVTAWCILAAVIAVVKAGSMVSAIYTVLFSVAFVLLMLKIIRPVLNRIGERHSHHDTLNKRTVAVFFMTLLVSAYIAEAIGIHALFGAFLAGVVMPQNPEFREVFTEKIKDVSLVLLLPLFFVLTGLRTEIGLLNEPSLWGLCVIIIALAITGKFLGSLIAARFTKHNWRDSLMLGALMNTRGLMELIVLNIGYDLGVLSPQVFSMLVIMALVTTFMTGPVLDVINYFVPEKKLPLETKFFTRDQRST